MKNSKKITGWVASYKINGIGTLLIVAGENKRQALAAFRDIHYEIVDETQVRKCCLIAAPGPEAVQRMPEKNWEEEAPAHCQ